MIGEVMMLSGALLTLLAGLGVLRFRDALSRMHSATKASALAVLLVLLGAALRLDHPNDITSLLLAAALQLLTSPVAANVLARSTYLADGIPNELDAVDELAQRRGGPPEPGSPSPFGAGGGGRP